MSGAKEHGWVVWRVGAAGNGERDVEEGTMAGMAGAGWHAKRGAEYRSRSWVNCHCTAA